MAHGWIKISLLLLLARPALSQTPANTTTEGPDESSTLRKLRQDLILVYDRVSRPVKNHLTQTKVDMRITINEVVQLDTVNSKMVTDAWFHISWRDEFLTWDPNQYSQIKQVHMSPAEIWKPDIVLINSADQDNILNIFTESEILVNSTGHVTWITMGLLHSKCPVWNYDFPFVIKPITCSLTFCSLIYESHEVNITTPGNEFFLAGPWMINPKIQVMNITGFRYEKFYESYGTYSFESLNIKMRRIGNALPMIIRIPTLTSIVMVLCMFFLPVTWPLRVQLALCAILIQLLLILYIGLQTGITAIGLARPISYLRDDLFLSTLALLLTLIFRRIMVLADSLPALPYAISSLFEGALAKFLCYGINESEYKQHTYSHNLASAAASSNNQYGSRGKTLPSLLQPSRGSFSIDHVSLINEDSDPNDLNSPSSTSAAKNQQVTSSDQSSNATSRINIEADTIKVPMISHGQREYMLLVIFFGSLIVLVLCNYDDTTSFLE